MADTPKDLRRLAYELCTHEPAPFELDVLHEAAALAHEDPAQLSDRHLQHLALYEPNTIPTLLKKRAEARERRAAQAFAEVQAACDQRAAAGVQFSEPRPLVTKTGTQAIDPASLDGVTTFAELAARYPDVPVTLDTLNHLVEPLAAFMQATNEKNKVRNARLDALEARVLEIEAQKAIADVTKR